MKTAVVALGLFLGALAVGESADHVWQRGTWRGLQSTTTVSGGAISLPVGGTPPTTMIGALGIPITTPGTPATYITIPTTGADHHYAVDGPDGFRYVARTPREFATVIVNDPIEFSVEGKTLYLKGAKPKDVYRLTLVSTTRLPPP
jgi:hypothetical protein